MRPFSRLLTGFFVLFMGHAGLAGLPAMAQTPAPQKSYSSGELDSDAVRLQESVTKRGALTRDPRSTADIRRDVARLIQVKEFARALEPLATALSRSPDDSALWLDYARAAMGLAQQDSSRRWRMFEESTAAAYIAYQKAPAGSAEAAALTELANIYANRSMWRLSLNTYRAALNIADNTAVRRVYEDLRAKHGFRILDYKVESDLVSPRICFQFSESLPGKTDYAPYVAVAGSANAAVTSEDRQLCVEGLKHGEKYSVVIRQGLPSVVDEQLLRSADYEIYIKDRSPQARFTGKNYVLPRIGQEGIPIISTNTPKVAIDVLRVGDRSLLPTLRSDDFLNQLGTYRMRDMLETKGVKAWTGTLDVKSELNKDVVTAFPVLEAVKKLEPGVFSCVRSPPQRLLPARKYG